MILQLKEWFGSWLKTGWAHPIRRRAVVASCIAVAFGGSVSVAVIHAKRQTSAWMRVYTKGIYVGLAPDRSLVSRTMKSLARGYHVPLKLQVVHQAVRSGYNWQTVAELPMPADAIVKDGQPLVYASSPQAAAAILKTVKAQLMPKRLPLGASVKFSGRISIRSAVVGVSQILQPASAVSAILHPNQAMLAGRSGSDLLTSIEGVSAPGIAKVNVSDTLRLGATSNASNPLLQVVALATVKRNVVVPYPVEYKSNDHLGKGTVRVVRKGKPGHTVQKVQLKYVDGHLTQQRVVAKTVVSQPQAEVAQRGTNRGIAGGSWIWPVSSHLITSPFGWRILFGAPNFHPGIDLGVPIGTPIYATNNGVVESAGWNSGGYGIWVELNNGNGIQTIFGHMSHEVVHVGETVYKGEVLGYSGETGFATGPHLHYEVRVNGKPVNPLSSYV